MSAQLLEFPSPSPKDEVKTVADCDNGYTRIANELLSAMAMADLTQRQFKVLLAVVRKTYGFNKPMDWCGNKQLAEATGLPETRCSTIKNELVQRDILIQKGRSIGPNPVITDWKKSEVTCSGKTFTKRGKETLPDLVKELLPKEVNTKDTYSKDKKDKDHCRADARRRNAEFVSQAKQVIEHLNAVCGRQYPTAGKCNTIKGVVTRLKAGATVEQLKAVIDHKNAEWGTSAKMVKYLQPSTLFKPSKIEENITDAQAWLASGKGSQPAAPSSAAPISARDVMTNPQAAQYLHSGGLFKELSEAVKHRIREAFRANQLPSQLVSILDEQEAFHD
ncbi:replication protein [Ferrimonas aestuarii]|uniref:Phage replication protein O n=1 Tax=Ferrimonas aestuarii TaxID=2569539 RepID=A0A4V5NVX5_9GAMM|nr:replication protein [Ferrimonas aestuarii]TKB53286.1 hypothetical protein FCL42_14535 [Ferrimonas aestuarii]